MMDEWFEQSEQGLRVEAALHEAAHATVAYVLKLPIISVSLGKRGGGRFRSKCPYPTPEERRQGMANSHDFIDIFARQLTMILAGPAAAFKHSGTLCGCNSDLGNALRYAHGLFPLRSDCQMNLLYGVLDRAHRLVEEHWAHIRYLAAQLFFVGQLNESEIRYFLRDCRQRPTESERRSARASTARPAPIARASIPSPDLLVDPHTGYQIGAVVREAGGYRAIVRGGDEKVFPDQVAARQFVSRSAPQIHYRTDGCFL
jgi:hypothetical protein